MIAPSDMLLFAAVVREGSFTRAARQLGITKQSASIGEVDDASLAARKLGEGHVYYVASPAYVAAHRRLRPRALQELRCIGMRAVETWEVSGISLKIEPALVVNDLEVACEAAVAGVGVARLPALVCRAAVESDRLRVLFRAQPAFLRPVYAVFPSRRHLPIKVRVFMDALSALVEPMQPLRPR